MFKGSPTSRYPEDKPARTDIGGPQEASLRKAIGMQTLLNEPEEELCPKNDSPPDISTTPSILLVIGGVFGFPMQEVPC